MKDVPSINGCRLVASKHKQAGVVLTWVNVIPVHSFPKLTWPTPLVEVIKPTLATRVEFLPRQHVMELYMDAKKRKLLWFSSG